MKHLKSFQYDGFLEAKLIWNSLTKEKRIEFIKKFDIKDKDLDLISKQAFSTLDYYLMTNMDEIIKKLFSEVGQR